MGAILSSAGEFLPSMLVAGSGVSLGSKPSICMILLADVVLLSLISCLHLSDKLF